MATLVPRKRGFVAGSCTFGGLVQTDGIRWEMIPAMDHVVVLVLLACAAIGSVLIVRGPGVPRSARARGPRHRRAAQRMHL